MGRTTIGAASSGKRDAASQLAGHRLGVLEFARELGNVSEACSCMYPAGARPRGFLLQPAGLPPPGYRNQGRRPIETINLLVSQDG